MNDTDAAPFDASRAELFEALSHPLRVRILQVLGECPQRFSELKHTLGLESSGHLSFHLEKLTDLVKPALDGTYALSDEGTDALRLLTTLNHMNEAPHVHVARKDALFNRKIVTVSLILIIIVLSPFAVYGLYVLLQPSLNQSVYRVHYTVTNSYGSNFPWLGVSLRNVGEKSIIAVRVELNGTLIPFSLGGSRESINPSQTRQGSVPLRWFDAQVNAVVDLTPVVGETYFGRLIILFEDGAVTLRDMNFTAQSGGCIASIVDTGIHMEVDADLFMRGGQGGVCSLWIRNVWWHENISDITILVNDEVVIDTPTNLRTGDYWAGSGTLPYPVSTYQTYNVTVHIRTSDGDVSALSRMVTPRPL